jgi:hypothetical protein
MDLVLHAWLITDEGEGDLFLADVWRMLQRVAGRDGCTLQAVANAASQQRGSSIIARLTGRPSKLVAEVGIHRAQRVPSGDAIGRITTSLVGVEILPLEASPSSGRPSGGVLKTYNYVGGSVIRHASGAKGLLADGLEGDV